MSVKRTLLLAPLIFGGLSYAGVKAEPVSISLVRQKMSLREWDGASKILEQMVQTGTDPVSLAEIYAEVLLHLGRRKDAVDLLRKAASRNPSRSKVLLEKARVSARIFLTSAGNQAYHDGIALAFRAKIEAALEQFKKANELEPENGEVVLRLGQIYLLQGELPRAVDLLELARDLMPGEPQVTLWLGRAVFLKGDRERSGVELRSAHEKLKHSERAVVWFADWLHQSGQRSEALKILDQHQRAYPLHLEAMLTAARIRFTGPIAPSPPQESQEQPGAEDSGGKAASPGPTPIRGSKELWELRKLLQLANSRFEEAMNLPIVRTEASKEALDLAIRDPEKLKEAIEGLLKQIDEELEGLKS